MEMVEPAEITGRVIELEVGAADVDATVIKGDGPVVVAEVTTVPAGGRVMVKERGAVVPSEFGPEDSVLMVETAVMVAEAPAATDVPDVTLGAC